VASACQHPASVFANREQINRPFPLHPADPVFAKSLLLAGIHWVESITWLVALSILLDRTRRLVLRSAAQRWLEGVCGAMLLAFGARLALERE